MIGREAEMHSFIHDMLAERAELQARVVELERELEVAYEMARAAARGYRPALQRWTA